MAVMADAKPIVIGDEKISWSQTDEKIRITIKEPELNCDSNQVTFKITRSFVLVTFVRDGQLYKLRLDLAKVCH